MPGYPAGTGPYVPPTHVPPPYVPPAYVPPAYVPPVYVPPAPRPTEPAVIPTASSMPSRAPRTSAAVPASADPYLDDDLHEFVYEPPGIVGWTGERRINMERPLNKIPQLVFDATSRTPCWEEWKQNYVATCGDRYFLDSIKICVLLGMLEGAPRALVNQYVTSPYTTDNYRRIWSTLESNFGGLQKKQKYLLAMIKDFPVIKAFNHTNTMLFENLLMKIRREFSEDPANIDPGQLLNDMLQDIMPPKEVDRYHWETIKAGRFDTIHSLTIFIRMKREQYTRSEKPARGAAATTCLTTIVPAAPAYPVASIPSHLLTEGSEDEDEAEYETHTAVEAPKKPFIPWKKPAIPAGTEAKVPYERPPKICTICKREHLLYSCPDFKMLSVKDKFTYVIDNKLCIHCLNPGHIVKDCTFH